MKIIIYTGKGGVGKTSVAAATGIKLAQMGIKTLVISTDLAHSLADSYGISLSHNPTPVMENLWAEELNPQTELEEHWEEIYHYFVHLFKVMGVKDVFAEEMTLFPGMEELFSLLEIYQHYQSGKFSAIILDCPPTGSTLRLLSYFDALGWYMERFFKIEKSSIKLIRFFTDNIKDIPLPKDDFFNGIEKLYRQMEKAKEILIDPEITSVRLVMNPEQMVINESQRAYTYLNLYGLNVDAVIVNKVLPADLDGEFFLNWRKCQMKNLQLIKDIFVPLKILTMPMMSDEVKGIKSLQRIAAYFQASPMDRYLKTTPMELNKEGDSYHFKVFMPFLEKKKFDLYQKGMLLIITVGSYKRKVLLPQVLSNKSVKDARYKGQYLHLYF